MLRDKSLRLITLTGPGGIGKSRLAIAVASRVHDAFTDGIVFVDLSPVDHSSGVIIAIAAALGVRDTGDGPLQTKVATALQHQSKLLIVDNFEQVVDAAPVLTTLLTAAPGVTVLVTSRIVLRVSGEHSFEVGPLSLPIVARGSSVDAAKRSGAVRLFIERAHAVKPDFELTESNAAAVVQICVALDGVPLALELAAARVRLLAPAVMLERLDRKLPLLVGGVRDLPARQKTLRSTIEWSMALLGPEEQELLTQLGVFAGTFSLEAVEYLYQSRSDVDVLALLGSLVDSSLIRQLDRGERSRFSMLATVREYAVECLQAQHILDDIREQHATYFIEVAQAAQAQLDGAEQRAWIRALTDDADNLRAAERYLLDTNQFTRAADFAWSLYLFWWVGGYLGEVRGWMDELLSRGTNLTPTTRAIALYFTQAITFWQDPDGRVVPGLAESAELFRSAHKPRAEALALVSLALAHLSTSPPDPHTAEQSLNRALSLFREDADRWGEAMTLVTVGRVDLLQQKVHGALNRFDESLALTAQQRDELGTAIAHHHRGWAHLILGSAETAQQSFESSLEMSVHLDHQEGIAYGLEGLVAIAAAAGDAERSGVLLGAAEGLREQTGLYNTPRFSFHQPFVEAILAGNTAVQFEHARTQGREMTVADAVEFAERV
jgi:predicted ATPase/predicted negative regulator of RcsB-dependent stress response